MNLCYKFVHPSTVHVYCVTVDLDWVIKKINKQEPREKDAVGKII